NDMKMLSTCPARLRRLRDRRICCDDGRWWFYPHKLNKFTVILCDKSTFSDHGSLTLYFQTRIARPGQSVQRAAIAQGNFLLTMRKYWPKETEASIRPSGKEPSRLRS